MDGTGPKSASQIAAWLRLEGYRIPSQGGQCGAVRRQSKKLPETGPVSAALSTTYEPN